MRMTVNPDKCPQNHACPSIALCPVSAIAQQDDHALPAIDPEKCVLCGVCRDYCPRGAFEEVE